MSSKAPLLLLHGVTMSSAAWDEVVPLLADDFDVIVPTLPGHRGGGDGEGGGQQGGGEAAEDHAHVKGWAETAGEHGKRGKSLSFL